MSNSCEKPLGIINMLSMREKNDVLSLSCAAVFLAHDFAIVDFPTPAELHIHSKKYCDD